MVQDLREVRHKLGEGGAAENAARAVLRVCGIGEEAEIKSVAGPAAGTTPSLT